MHAYRDAIRRTAGAYVQRTNRVRYAKLQSCAKYRVWHEGCIEELDITSNDDIKNRRDQFSKEDE